MIAPIQANVLRTSFGHGKSWNPIKKDEVSTEWHTPIKSFYMIYSLQATYIINFNLLFNNVMLIS